MNYDDAHKKLREAVEFAVNRSWPFVSNKDDIFRNASHAYIKIANENLYCHVLVDIEYVRYLDFFEDAEGNSFAHMKVCYDCSWSGFGNASEESTRKYSGLLNIAANFIADVKSILPEDTPIEKLVETFSLKEERARHIKMKKEENELLILARNNMKRMRVGSKNILIFDKETELTWPRYVTSLDGKKTFEIERLPQPEGTLQGKTALTMKRTS